MAGHSKWAQIKRKKASMDSKRGKIFSKLAKSISVAAKMGGGDPEMNPTLRLAVEKAKAANMPMENIKKAIIKGTGELSGTEYESAIYEGYGPGGAAIMIEVLTDNKNRTVSELRHIMTRHGGTMAEAGSVAWMFHKKGVILVDKRSVDEDLLMDIVLEAGAEDLKNDPEEDVYEITTSVDDFQRVKEAIEDASIKISHAEISMVPTTYVKLEGKDAEQMGKLFDALDDHDDVQNIYTNVDMPE
ncbi:MAG: YebC/PmpR family DNA-binding transcriptional regulator [Nitrospirae bacterium]|nr:MAG: YebC/PmpR family DNA-binding transcriptional regulator [Nitrospirota bacterium]